MIDDPPLPNTLSGVGPADRQPTSKLNSDVWLLIDATLTFLLNSLSGLDWPLTRSLATSPDSSISRPVIDVGLASGLGGFFSRRRGVPSSYRPGPMELELTGLTQLAAERVGDEARLWPSSEPRARVLSRDEWVASAAAGVERLAGPALARLEQQRPTKLPAVFQRVSAQVGGLELGGVLAWLSGRVLGQYDVLVGDQPTEAEDVISYVGPNIVALEQRLGFEPGPFRLWLCLHESAHRAQFEGAPWVRTYFLGLIDEAMGAMPTSGASVLTGLTRAASDALKGKSVLGEHGLVGLVASEEQLTAMRRLSALMSVLEGHGEVVMDEAARDLVPQADHFHSALRARRADPSSTSSMASRLLGLEAKLRQYEEGERFVRHLRDTGGPSLVAELFEGPEHLPSLDEVRTPQLWLERASGSRSAARR